MKNITLIIAVLITFTFFISCSSKSGKVGNIDPEDITYIKDNRTDLCFGIIGAKKGSNLIDNSTSIGMACVPCEKVKKLIIEK